MEKLLLNSDITKVIINLFMNLSNLTIRKFPFLKIKIVEII